MWSRPLARGGGEGSVALSPHHWRLRLAVAALWASGAVILFVSTAPAGAVDLFPIDDLIGDGIGELGGVAGDVVEKGFGYIVETLFGGSPAKLTTGLLKWLIRVPDLSGGGVARLQ